MRCWYPLRESFCNEPSRMKNFMKKQQNSELFYEKWQKSSKLGEIKQWGLARMLDQRFTLCLIL